MSRELFKSMTYKNDKVYTRQCSNNVYPKDFYCEENLGLTRQYNKLGQNGFEKWFLTNGVMQGNIEILNGSNKILRRLNYLANLLWEDQGFKNLRNNENKAFEKSLNAKTEYEKDVANSEYQKAEEDIANYISSFYDSHNSKYKENERSR